MEAIRRKHLAFILCLQGRKVSMMGRSIIQGTPVSTKDLTDPMCWWSGGTSSKEMTTMHCFGTIHLDASIMNGTDGCLSQFRCLGSGGNNVVIKQSQALRAAGTAPKGSTDTQKRSNRKRGWFAVTRRMRRSSLICRWLIVFCTSVVQIETKG